MRYKHRRVFALLVFFLTIVGAAKAQTTVRGKITDAANHQPLEGITVLLLPEKISCVTDQLGNFAIKQEKKGNTSVQISSIGYQSQTISLEDLKSVHNNVSLEAQSVELKAVTISAHAGDQYKIISKTDIAMRGVNNSQEVLRIIPGIVIGQHQGGGKAEQIFLRGFDADHGTDFRLDVDGLPINMVSHAHGQGFADSHFIIPETIESVDFKKGPYTASKGDFAHNWLCRLQHQKHAFQQSC